MTPCPAEPETRGSPRCSARCTPRTIWPITWCRPTPTLPCVDCGHIRSNSEERRHEYDHHLGYAAEHHEHVEPVCTTCHHRRENERRAAA